jgi:uncharacterized protein
MVEVIGYLITVLVGITLGLIGGGGSIFTIPLLVYLFKIQALEATSYSHFVVGITAMVASVNYIKTKKVHFESVLYFGVPAMISVYFVRAFLLPIIPNTIYLGQFSVSEDALILLLFAVLMIVASYSMIRKCENCVKEDDGIPVKFNFPLIILSGFGVGIITGIVGAGGGFLIIPSLVFFARLSMKKAIATSLFIIAFKSMIGFSSEIGSAHINWNFLITISLLSVLGMFLGTFLNKKIDGEKLKPVFGWFVLLMGLSMLAIELYEFVG